MEKETLKVYNWSSMGITRQFVGGSNEGWRANNVLTMFLLQKDLVFIVEKNCR